MGIEGEGRWPSHRPNNASALEYGHRLADSLQSAIKADIMWRPLGKPISVNAGMSDWESSEETRMTSDSKWRECFYRAGCPASLVKSDWNIDRATHSGR